MPEMQCTVVDCAFPFLDPQPTRPKPVISLFISDLQQLIYDHCQHSLIHCPVTMTMPSYQRANYRLRGCWFWFVGSRLPFPPCCLCCVVLCPVVHYSRFRVFSPDCTLHTAITHMILVLERQSLTHDYAIGIHETPAFHYCYHVSDCSVQFAIGTKNSETTVSLLWYSDHYHLLGTNRFSGFLKLTKISTQQQQCHCSFSHPQVQKSLIGYSLHCIVDFHQYLSFVQCDHPNVEVSEPAVEEYVKEQQFIGWYVTQCMNV